MRQNDSYFCIFTTSENLTGVPLYRHIADLAGLDQVIMPVPAFNIINGGSHAGNKLAMQVTSSSRPSLQQIKAFTQVQYVKSN